MEDKLVKGVDDIISKVIGLATHSWMTYKQKPGATQLSIGQAECTTQVCEGEGSESQLRGAVPGLG